MFNGIDVEWSTGTNARRNGTFIVAVSIRRRLRSPHAVVRRLLGDVKASKQHGARRRAVERMP
ncbi:hypothetical protein, partial [Brachybacterium alimentarium]|uniref:hypothetical protein n=1 Tax=Brachybacterium alimentarium TaxID=47845 RepID=UPI0031DE89A7